MKALSDLGLKLAVGLFSLLLVVIPFGSDSSPYATTHTVEIVGMKFKPAVVNVHKGDQIIFINRDMVAHNITEISGKSWKSPNLATGKSWNLTASQSASYYCTFHPVMKGSISVVAR